MKAISLKAGGRAQIPAVINSVADAVKGSMLKIGIVAAVVALFSSVIGAMTAAGVAAAVAVLAVYSLDKQKGGEA